MSDVFARPESTLVEAMETTMRGPRRNGLFAVWLVLRAGGDLLPPYPAAEHAHRRRIGAVEHRLHSLALPPPLRRALTGALERLREGTARDTAIALRQLATPVRETLGAGPGEAVARAARLAEERAKAE